MNENIRVRFAPSNTGHLHIGGARTALFNWFFARHHGGTTILRVEDTDLKRSTEEYYDAILEAFEWLDLDWDEGPYRQTKRLEIYTEVAEKMLEAGTAYRCTCTPDEVDIMRQKARAEGKTPKYDTTCRGRYDSDPSIPFCLRLKTPEDGVTVVSDLLAGLVTFQNDQLDDTVIVRTDGTPTYNFCVAVDDIDMRISHVIRGNDHLSNTPKQILVYKALDKSPPHFAHISMILGPDKKRLSKRHGATSVLEYREQGYLPAAFTNYLVRLGWSLGDQEIFTQDEIVKNFSIENLNLSAAVFNPEKMLWMNQEYIMKSATKYLLPLLEERLRRHDLDPNLLPYTSRLGIVEELKTRAKTLEDMAASAEFFFSPSVRFNEKAADKFLNREISRPLERVRESIARVDPFIPDGVKAAFDEVLKAEGMKLGKLAQPVRVAVTGSTVSPGIFETLCLLGKDRSLERIDKAISRIDQL